MKNLIKNNLMLLIEMRATKDYADMVFFMGDDRRTCTLKESYEFIQDPSFLYEANMEMMYLPIFTYGMGEAVKNRTQTKADYKKASHGMRLFYYSCVD